MKSISDLIPSQKGIVIKIELPDKLKRRLFDLGLIEGTEIECVETAPSGDPKAYLIRGAVIAVRKDEGKKILLKEGSLWD